MLSWIPLLGPIFQGVSSIIGNFTSLAAVKLQTGAQVAISETQASAQIIHDTNDSISLRFMRDAYCAPAVVQVLFTGWDNLVAENSWHSYMWHVSAFPPSLSWYPLSVGVFLLGNIGINTWMRSK